MVRKLDNLKSWNVEKGPGFVNYPNFYTIFCRIIFKYPAIPRPSSSGIHWPINFTKKNWDFWIFLKEREKVTSLNRDILYILVIPDHMQLLTKLHAISDNFINQPSDNTPLPPCLENKGSFKLDWFYTMLASDCPDSRQ